MYLSFKVIWKLGEEIPSQNTNGSRANIWKYSDLRWLIWSVALFCFEKFFLQDGKNECKIELNSYTYVYKTEKENRGKERLQADTKSHGWANSLEKEELLLAGKEKKKWCSLKIILPISR